MPPTHLRICLRPLIKYSSLFFYRTFRRYIIPRGHAERWIALPQQSYAALGWWCGGSLGGWNRSRGRAFLALALWCQDDQIADFWTDEYKKYWVTKIWQCWRCQLAEWMPFRSECVNFGRFSSVGVGSSTPNTLSVWSKLIFAGFVLCPFFGKSFEKVRAFNAQNCDWGTRSTK